MKDTSPKNDEKRKKKIVFSSLEEYEKWKEGIKEAISYLEGELGGIN